MTALTGHNICTCLAYIILEEKYNVSILEQKYIFQVRLLYFVSKRGEKQPLIATKSVGQRRCSAMFLILRQQFARDISRAGGEANARSETRLA